MMTIEPRNIPKTLFQLGQATGVPLLIIDRDEYGPCCYYQEGTPLSSSSKKIVSFYLPADLQSVGVDERVVMIDFLAHRVITTHNQLKYFFSMVEELDVDYLEDSEERMQRIRKAIACYT